MEVQSAGPGDLIGVIRHRLLINQLVDPAEAASRLPDGLRPHVSSTGGVVVGCCLLEINSARPWPMPSKVGLSQRAAAHRISAEVVSRDGCAERAVYVPSRHSDGLLPVMAGGRLLPGVHHRAEIDAVCDEAFVSWSIQGGEGFNISATADRATARVATSEVAEIVIGTELGISPGHRAGSIEYAELCPASPLAHVVELTSLESDYLNGFTTAEPAETLLMTDAKFVWRRSSVNEIVE